MPEFRPFPWGRGRGRLARENLMSQSNYDQWQGVKHRIATAQFLSSSFGSSERALISLTRVAAAESGHRNVRGKAIAW